MAVSPSCGPCLGASDRVIAVATKATLEIIDLSASEPKTRSIPLEAVVGVWVRGPLVVASLNTSPKKMAVLREPSSAVETKTIEDTDAIGASLVGPVVASPGPATPPFESFVVRVWESSGPREIGTGLSKGVVPSILSRSIMLWPGDVDLLDLTNGAHVRFPIEGVDPAALVHEAEFALVSTTTSTNRTLWRVELPSRVTTKLGVLPSGADVVADGARFLLVANKDIVSCPYVEPSCIRVQRKQAPNRVAIAGPTTVILNQDSLTWGRAADYPAATNVERSSVFAK